MSDEGVIEVPRDTALEQRMLAAVIEDRNSTARNRQVLAGPSSIGFCRELLRHTLFEGGTASAEAQESHWATAAHVGTVMGDALEEIFGERLGALTQQRITTELTKLGLRISGAMDLVFLDESDDQVSDLKSTTDIGGMLYDLRKNEEIIASLLAIRRDGDLFNRAIETPDGSYELTQKLVGGMSKLQYYTQIAVYVTGARQAGVLSPEAEGRLVFYDRAGDYQDFVALRVSAEVIDLFFDVAQARIEQVAEAQRVLEEYGDPTMIHYLRDQPPAFCFSPKVMCPLRHRCWGGSDWAPMEEIDSAEVGSSIDRYIEGRRLAKLGDGMKKAAREELRGIEGRTADGRMVTWVNNKIGVVEPERVPATEEAENGGQDAT